MKIKGIARVKFLPGKLEEWEAPDGRGQHKGMKVAVTK
jgi:hypothetical protein